MASWNDVLAAGDLDAEQFVTEPTLKALFNNTLALAENASGAPEVLGAELELISKTEYDAVGDPGYLEVMLPELDKYFGLEFVAEIITDRGDFVNSIVAADLYAGVTELAQNLFATRWAGTNTNQPNLYRFGFGMDFIENPYSASPSYIYQASDTGLKLVQRAIRVSNGTVSSSLTTSGGLGASFATKADRIRFIGDSTNSTNFTRLGSEDVTGGTVWVYGLRKTALD